MSLKLIWIGYEMKQLVVRSGGKARFAAGSDRGN